MAAITGRRFFEELSGLIEKTVLVEDREGKQYEGVLLGYDSNTMSIVLGDVKSIQGKLIHRIFLSGNNLSKILASERPFNLSGLKERLDRVFPNMVQIFPEAGVLLVMGKIRVNESGVIEGTGPAADRVRDIYQRFVSETL